jgi:glycosyltransferase involved in cell wall biosynthesis
MKCKDKKYSTEVCFVTHSFTAPQTGGERYNWEAVNSLLASGFDVRILTDRLMPRFIKGRRFLAYNLWYIYKFSDKGRFILFTTNYMSPRLLLFSLFSKLFKNVKIFVLVYHLRYHDYENRVLRFLALQIERLFLSFSDILIAISQSTRRELVNLKKKDKGIYLVNPGIDPMDFMVDSRKNLGCFNILFVGDCVKRKGLKYLIKALSLLREEDVHLHVVGNLEKDLAHSSYICHLTKKLDLGHRITFHGRLDGKRKERLLAQSQVFVLPSLWEGYGLAIAEAMQVGLPIIATRAGATPELIVDGINGILVPPKDAASLAQALKFLLKNPDVREGFRRQSLLLSEKFNSWKEVGESIVKIFGRNIS